MSLIDKLKNLTVPDPEPLTPLELPAPVPDPVPEPEPLAPEPYTPHPLDLAEVNAKIVVVLDVGVKRAVLATPAGVSDLPAGDPAGLLPEGARIRKVGETRYQADQIGSVEPAKDYETATAAIADFLPHFHAR